MPSSGDEVGIAVLSHRARRATGRLARSPAKNGSNVALENSVANTKIYTIHARRKDFATARVLIQGKALARRRIGRPGQPLRATDSCITRHAYTTRKPLGYGGYRIYCRPIADGICSRGAFLLVTRSRRAHWPWPSCKIRHQFCAGVLYGKCFYFSRPWIWNEIV